MRCSCRVCGAYMVQREQGIFSGCVCPECFSSCHMCTQSEGGTPKSPDELRSAFMLRAPDRDDGETDPFSAPISPAEYED